MTFVLRPIQANGKYVRASLVAARRPVAQKEPILDRPIPLPFHEIGRLPEPEDNVAIAVRRLEAGTRIVPVSGEPFVLGHTVLEGHRFAVRAIPEGAEVLSWNLPFGTALCNIAPGDYICNREILEALRIRQLDFPLPEQPNFKDRMDRYRLDKTVFRAGHQMAPFETPPTFWGYQRPGSRGCGTRNHIVLLGTTSQTASFVKRLETRLKDAAAHYPHIDGIVAVAHTEGGVQNPPNNRELLLRTLSGYVVHPNVGAILLVDYGTESVTNAMVRAYLEEYGYPLGDVLHAFLSLKDGFDVEMERAAGVVTGWLETVNRAERAELPASHLKIALQCGGSDAFSGVSANPLLACVARDVVRSGGAANLAETDELIGAESYVLSKVRDFETAKTFLDMVERFKERVAWHGQTVDANPSGGNKFRGLYNIALKSIGAARKKHPDIRLDHAIEYGQPMTDPGYYFMDSPGNDLESIAGQVACGCNMIFFTTGNGSITNFPFVPTIKIVTTTKRFELLSKDMDVNAGVYLDGTPMEELARQTFDLTLRVASGERTTGERAGHAQVSIWRNWPQGDGIRLPELLRRSSPPGKPLSLRPGIGAPQRAVGRIESYLTDGQPTTDRVGLILPTSLCSSQIARMAAERLNRKAVGRAQGISRFVALSHTEGCGVSGGASESLYARTMAGYLVHPMVACALLMEHGCERTHNDFYRQQLQNRSLDLDRFGWASVQLDGGIERVLGRTEAWFAQTLTAMDLPGVSVRGLEALRLGLAATGPVSESLAAGLAGVVRTVVETGGTVVVPDHAQMLAMPVFRDTVTDVIEPCLAYGQPFSEPGLYIMDTQTSHWLETLVGLGATGVEVVLAGVSGHPVQGHPMIPLVQAASASLPTAFHGDVDLMVGDDVAVSTSQMLDLLCAVASRQYTPRAAALGNVDFQITRGLLGVSM